MPTRRTQPTPEPASSASLLSEYRRVRRQTVRLVEPLSDEDMTVQSMPDASPTKWHLAHTTWFFETFVLAQADACYRPYRDDFAYLFNSYYQGAGPRYERPSRGLLTRPSAGEVMAYRDVVDERMLSLLSAASGSGLIDRLGAVVEIGLHHEMQHQELILSDIKHLLSRNPLRPAYADEAWRPADAEPAEFTWTAHPAGLHECGDAGEGFAFDNERPRHKVWVDAFAAADRLVTNGEYLRFIDDGGYERGELWLDEGWSTLSERGWKAPLYWRRDDAGAWREFTLLGEHPLDPARPLMHVSYFEADAYARWAGARMLTEQEWEVSVGASVPIDLAPISPLHPDADTAGALGPRQAYRSTWEWTGSQYRPYPGFTPAAGTLGEYNGKFMSNQFVLRGGSFAADPHHLRPTYRNFFHADKRWQFAGIRLGKDA